jgi:hypothetical protein
MGPSVLVARVKVDVEEGVGRVREGCAGGPTRVAGVEEIGTGAPMNEEGCSKGPTRLAGAEEVGTGAPTNVEGLGAGSVMRLISKVKDNTWKPPVFAQNSAL